VSRTIRPAVPADAETITETVLIGFEGYREFAPPGWIPPGAGELARTRARLTADGTWALVAEEGGAPAGHVGFVPHAGVPASAHLWSLFVRPAW
jgi:hypothetical protein